MNILKYLQVPAIVIGLIVLLFTVIEVRSCINERQNEIYAGLKGQYEAYKTKVFEEKKEWEAQKVQLDKKNKELKEQIIQITNDQQELNKEIEAKSEQIKKLEKKFSLIQDPTEKIKNLKDQISAWKEKFNLAIDDRNQAERKAAKWKLLYQNLKIDYSLMEKQLRDQKALNDISKDRIFTLEKKLHKGFFDKIGTIAMKALAAKEGFDILKGAISEQRSK